MKSGRKLLALNLSLLLLLSAIPVPALAAQAPQSLPIVANAITPGSLESYDSVYDSGAAQQGGYSFVADDSEWITIPYSRSAAFTPDETGMYLISLSGDSSATLGSLAVYADFVHAAPASADKSIVFVAFMEAGKTYDILNDTDNTVGVLTLRAKLLKSTELLSDSDGRIYQGSDTVRSTGGFCSFHFTPQHTGTYACSIPNVDLLCLCSPSMDAPMMGEVSSSGAAIRPRLQAGATYYVLVRVGQGHDRFDGISFEPLRTAPIQSPIGQIEGGTVTLDQTDAVVGEQVTITVAPDGGFQVDQFIITDTAGNVIETTRQKGNTYVFTMPDSAITVQVSFVLQDSVIGVAYASTQVILVDDTPVEFEMYALKNAKGYLTNYVKLRDVAFALNDTPAQFGVGWDRATNSVTIQSDTHYDSNGSEMSTPYTGDQYYFTSDSPTLVDGEPTTLESFLLKDNRGKGYTYYKLRDLGEALNFNVLWIRDTDSIQIQTDKPYGWTEPTPPEETKPDETDPDVPAWAVPYLDFLETFHPGAESSDDTNTPYDYEQGRVIFGDFDLDGTPEMLAGYSVNTGSGAHYGFFFDQDASGSVVQINNAVCQLDGVSLAYDRATDSYLFMDEEMGEGTSTKDSYYFIEAGEDSQMKLTFAASFDFGDAADPDSECAFNGVTAEKDQVLAAQQAFLSRYRGQDYSPADSSALDMEWGYELWLATAKAYTPFEN